MATDPKSATALRPIASCPSCGRRPSERIAVGWKPEYEGPMTLCCNDATHALADRGPELEHALAAWWKARKARADLEPTGADAELVAEWVRITGKATVL